MCDFEDGSCNWQQHTDDHWDWVRLSGSSASHDTGPSSDHTTNSPYGHYFSLPSSFEDVQGQTAKVSSALYPAGETGSQFFKRGLTMLAFILRWFAGVVPSFDFFLFALCCTLGLQEKGPACSCGTTCMEEELESWEFTNRVRMGTKQWSSPRQEIRLDCGGLARLHFSPKVSHTGWVQSFKLNLWKVTLK